MRAAAFVGQNVSRSTRRCFSIQQASRASPVAPESTSARQWSTPLAKTIAQAIATTGPISLAAFMRQCLTSPAGGYYTQRRQGNDQFGRHGDFVTSPEISQVFGELIGIWIVAESMAQGHRDRGIQLVELGPGRGTLMDDILRTIGVFKHIAGRFKSIALVEASPGLREQQAKLLCKEDHLIQTKLGFEGRAKALDAPITWYEDLKEVPHHSTQTPFIIAHEFFDALPIHAFQSIAPSAGDTMEIPGLSGSITIPKTNQALQSQWRELLVNTAPLPSIIRSTEASRDIKSPGKPEFEMSLAKASTPSSLILPESSPRYKALKARAGSVIEVCPDARSITTEIARRIGGDNGVSDPAQLTVNSQSTSDQSSRGWKPAGAALIIDYGPTETVPTNTLRGINNHQRVSPFERPGAVDLSADVDFAGLAEAAIDGSEGIEVHGPVEQGDWLKVMGVQERVQILIKAAQAKGDTQTAQDLQTAVDRLLEKGGGGMGRLYKFLTIIPEAGGRRRPVGFGGNLTT